MFMDCLLAQSYDS
jgi:hypothetical protein